MNTSTLFKSANGIQIAYTDVGNREDIPVIFIHGFPLDKSMWNSQLRHFSTSFRTIAYDIRGFGESEIGDENFSIDLFTEDLERFMDALLLEKVVLCGFSMGGYIALKAMQKFPEKIIGLILADTQCQADTEEIRQKRMKSCENIRRGSLSLFADEMLTSLLHKSQTGEESKDILALRSVIEGTAKDALCGSLIAMANRNSSCGTLQHIKIPTLIVVGDDDPITPREKAEEMQAKIPGATLHIIPYAKHLSNMDNPENFNRNLESLLNRVEKHRSHLPLKS